MEKTLSAALPFMWRTLHLARLGAGAVSPNPQVGAVVTHAGRIIGEGWHQKFGEPHAEVNALRAVRQIDRALLPEAAIFVSLEPCSHFGKTPPCADLIVKEQIKYVFILSLDPNPLVAGRGVARLKKHGIHVWVLSEYLKTGEVAPIWQQLYAESQAILKPFFKNILQQKPYIILKWAQDAHQKMGLATERVQISNPESRRLVHRWRAEADAILVGTNTVLLDNPKLDTRYFPNSAMKTPFRVVIDRNGKILLNNNDFHVLDKTVPTIVFTAKKRLDIEENDKLIIRQIDFDDDVLNAMLTILYRDFKVGILFVEGGAKLLQSFLAQNLWDEARILQTPYLLRGGGDDLIEAPNIAEKFLTNRFQLNDNEVKTFFYS